MSKQFIKTAGGLQEVAKPKIRVYDGLADFEADLADPSTTLQEGDLITTEWTEGAADQETAIGLLNSEVNAIKECIPEDASSTNQLLTAGDLDLDNYYNKDEVDGLLDDKQDVDLSSQIGTSTTVEGALDDHETRIGNIEDKIPAGATSSNKLVAYDQLPVYTFDAVNKVLTITLGS